MPEFQKPTKNYQESATRNLYSNAKYLLTVLIKY